MPILSENYYSLPYPQDTIVTQIVKDSPAHEGPYSEAIDFAMSSGTDVLAPADGVVMKVVDDNEKYGSTAEYSPYCNYVQIWHDHDEISDLIHLEKDSVVVKTGDEVKRGQIIGRTGLSGWMTEPHLHWMVWKKDESGEGFYSLEIQYK